MNDVCDWQTGFAVTSFTAGLCAAAMAILGISAAISLLMPDAFCFVLLAVIALVLQIVARW